MSNSQKHQCKIFTKDNLPDLLEYLADYMREHPECKEGFGLEFRGPTNVWKENKDNLWTTISDVYSIEYRPAPLTKTMYNIYTGEPVEVPENTKLEIIGFSGTNPIDVRSELTKK